MADKGNKESLSERLTVGIWDRISGFFSLMWRDVWKSLNDSLSIFADGIVTTITSRTGYGKYIGLPGKVNNASAEFKVPSEVQKVLDALEADGSASGATASLFYTLLYQLMVAANTLPAMMGKARLKANKTFMPSSVDMGYLINLYYKNPELKAFAIDKGRENGFSEEDVNKIFDSARSLFGVSEIREMALRGLLSDEEVNKKLQQSGYGDEEIAGLKKLFYIIPPVSDIVRMAVREAFTPEVVQSYGLHSDLPPDFIAKAEMAGLDVDWAKAYWAAHWELPSLSMAFEMFHRKVISAEDIQLLLRTQDIMPYWRDKLIQIAYSPYTRVDVRRMYNVGVLNEEDVFNSYQDIGYDEEKAAKLTEFTIAYGQAKEKDLTKSDILDGYKKRLFTREVSINYLKTLGYDDNEADYYICRCDYVAAKEEKNISLNNIKKMFLKNIVTDNQLYELLGKLNIGSGETQYLISLWNKEKEVKDKDFPLGSLHEVFKKGFISEEDYRNELEGKGFDSKYIGWFMQLYGGK